METKELFDLLQRCANLSIRGNAKAIQQTNALVTRVTALEQAGRDVLNALTESELELARGAWGNTNTNIVYDVMSKLAELLKENNRLTPGAG